MDPYPLPAQTAAAFLQEASFSIRTLDEAQLLAEFLAAACPQPRAAMMGLSEMLINAIEHGNLGISFEEKSHLKPGDEWIKEVRRRLEMPCHLTQSVKVHWRRLETEIQITIQDQGQGFDWKKYQHMPLHPAAQHGRGIQIASDLTFKELRYSEIGNEVTCIIAL